MIPLLFRIDKCDYVFVFYDVLLADFLPFEFCTVAPYVRIAKVLLDVTVDLCTDLYDR